MAIKRPGNTFNWVVSEKDAGNLDNAKVALRAAFEDIQYAHISIQGVEHIKTDKEVLKMLEDQAEGGASITCRTSSGQRVPLLL